ncbi:MAG: hypothetical protein ACXWU1_08195, partial [Allosphingosinicella sp.]
MTLAAAFLGLMTSVGPAGLATAAPAPAPAPAAIAAPAAPENVVLAFQDATQPADEVTAEPAAEAPPQLNERGEPPLTPVEQELLDERRRPDIEREHPDAVEQDNPGAIRSPPPEAFPSEYIPIPDRWRLIQSLGVVTERWWD